MGHDENTNNFGSAMDELNRISADSNPNVIQSSGTGDIVLNNDGGGVKKDKKIIILVVLLILAVIAVIVSAVITKGGVIGGGGNNDSKNKLAEATKSYSEKVVELETMVKSVKEGKTTAENSFTEDVKNQLDDDYSAFVSLKNEVKAFTNRDNSVSEVNSLLDKMNETESGYSTFVETYNDYYKAFTSHDKTSIEKYLTGDGSAKKATEAYIEYLNNYNTIQKNKELLQAQNCMSQSKLNTQQLQNCSAMIDADMVYEAALRNGEYFRAIFNEAINNITISKDDSINQRIIVVKGYLEL